MWHNREAQQTVARMLDQPVKTLDLTAPFNAGEDQPARYLVQTALFNVSGITVPDAALAGCETVGQLVQAVAKHTPAHAHD